MLCTACLGPFPKKGSRLRIAEGDDGPFIPSMGIEAIVRKALDGHQPALGARPAVNELELADYEALFANRTIHIGTRDETVDNGAPLFARLLGDAWQQLPPAVRQMHTLVRAVDGRPLHCRTGGS